MKNPFTFSFHWPWIENAFSDKDKRYSRAHILYILSILSQLKNVLLLLLLQLLKIHTA